MPWLKLIRWKNLLIIFLTQFLAWYCVIVPLNPAVLRPFSFFLIALSTMLIAASGYIINDYFDIKIDAINRPDEMVLGKTIPTRNAIIIHSVLNLIALICAGFVAWQAHNYYLLLVQLSCTVLLWYYSTNFKREFMIGNIVVSLLTALTIVTLILYEPVVLEVAHLPVFRINGNQSSLPFWVLMIYAWFAFMLNWIREIVKDMEDLVGDAGEGCTTMPIVKGLRFSANFILSLAVLVLVPLLVACLLLFQHGHLVFSFYVFFVLVLPIVCWSIFLNNSFNTKHFNRASSSLKLIMLLGVASLIIYYLQL